MINATAKRWDSINELQRLKSLSTRSPPPSSRLSQLSQKSPAEPASLYWWPPALDVSYLIAHQQLPALQQPPGLSFPAQNWPHFLRPTRKLRQSRDHDMAHFLAAPAFTPVSLCSEASVSSAVLDLSSALGSAPLTSLKHRALTRRQRAQEGSQQSESLKTARQDIPERAEENALGASMMKKAGLPVTSSRVAPCEALTSEDTQNGAEEKAFSSMPSAETPEKCGKAAETAPSGIDRSKVAREWGQSFLDSLRQASYIPAAPLHLVAPVPFLVAM